MFESPYTKEQFDNLFEVVLNLDSKVRQLESDIYDMQLENADTRRRLSDLESRRSGIPF